MKSRPKLENCPFCNSTAKYSDKSGSYGYYPPRVRVVCPNCDARQRWHDCEGWTREKGTFSTEAEAVNAAAAEWNLRKGVLDKHPESGTGQE